MKIKRLRCKLKWNRHKWVGKHCSRCKKQRNPAADRPRRTRVVADLERPMLWPIVEVSREELEKVYPKAKTEVSK